MKDFINYYSKPDEIISQFNMDLIERRCDRPLVSYIVDTFKSLEVIDNVEFLDYKYITDESQIDSSEFISTRDTSAARKDKKFMFIKDNRFGELSVRFKLVCYSKKDKEVKTKIITKKVLLPEPDENNYFQLKGKRYFLLYQLLENSTYNTKDSIIVKSLFGIAVKRDFVEIQEKETGEYFNCPIYYVPMFKKDRQTLAFFFVQYGLQSTLIFFNVQDIIQVIPGRSPEADPDFGKDTHCFIDVSRKRSTGYIKVNKRFMVKYKYIRGMVAMLHDVLTKVHHDHWDNHSAWIEFIGVAGAKAATKNKNYSEKGKSTMIFLTRMLDRTTQRILRVSDENKRNVFCIIRWLIQNFDELREKDNLDLCNKRLRYNEFIAAVFQVILSERINRYIAKGRNADLKDLEDVFKFPANRVMTLLFRSGLLRYDEQVNDLDALSKLKFSLKGVASLGNRNSKNIQKQFRALNPSHIGRIDINVVGNSDKLCPAV